MAFSVHDQRISDDGPTVEQAFDVLAMWCQLADEAKPLFEALLVRLRTARDEVQGFYIAPNDQRDRDRVLKALKDELVTFSIELQRYFGVRELTATPEPSVRWTEKMFASRVLQHIKLHRKLYEMHGGVHSSDNGLDRLFLLLKADEKNYNEWRDPFTAAVDEFKKAVADNVEKADMEVYKKDSLLALEAVTLLRNAETFSDAYEWVHNEPGKSLCAKLKHLQDWGSITLPDWFIPESDISYKRRSIAMGSFGTSHYGTWASGINVIVKRLHQRGNEKFDKELREAFIKEADLWFRLTHPYVLKLYGACHVTTPPFFVFEESKEGDLSDFLRTDRGKPRLWCLLFQSALAIEYLHNKRIVHGDLKLDNILVGADGYARVADFGMSRYKKQSRDLTLTVSETKLDGAGALRWRAPEALNAKAQLKSDVYSFAMCLIQAIGGRIPYYDVEDDDEVRRRISAGELPEKPKDMDDPIWELVRKMTASDPAARPSMTDIIPDLMKRANDELEREIDRTICPDCSLKLENGVTICPRCKRNIFEVSTIKSREDLPSVIELLTLTDRHNLKGAMAMSDYSREHQEEWISVFEAGAVPILSKILLDGNDDAPKVDALKALGIVIVGSRLTQNATKYIMANHQFVTAVMYEEVLRTLRGAMGEGEINLKITAVKVVGFWPKRNEIDEGLVSWIRDAAVRGDNPLLQAAAERALKFLGVPTAEREQATGRHLSVAADRALKFLAQSTTAIKDQKQLPNRRVVHHGLMKKQPLLIDSHTTFTDTDVKTPLHLAALEGNVQVVKFLLRVNSDPNAADENGETPLHKASNKGQLEVVQLLLESGADPCALNKDGITPLHLASAWGHEEVAELLLKANADPNAANKHGETSLHWASREGYSGVVNLLLKVGADPNAADELGRTPLHFACGNHESEVVLVLLAGGADVNSKDNNGREAIHACIETLQHNQHENPFSNETLKTLQSLVSYGATWDAACDDMVASGRASDDRRSVLLWAEEHTNGLEFSRIPVRVVKRGVGSTQGLIDGLEASHEIVLRRKICLVGSSFAGKTSFVKSIISQQPQLDHLDDRTIGIDHFPLRFASRDETKIHEVTFWDFVGQDVYQVAHSLYFSPRTLFLVFVDLQAFASAYMQSAIFANEVYQEAELLDEFVEQSISRWIRLICARQSDAEFFFIATKYDVLQESMVTEILLKDELMRKLRAVGALVEQMKEAAAADKDAQADVKFASIPDTSIEIASHEPPVLFVSCSSLRSVKTARMRIEALITESERSHPMPDIYSRAREVIMKIREEAKALDNYERISRVIVAVDALSAQLNIEPGRCRSILRTLHDLGDVLWYESLGIAFFHNWLVLDPLLLIDFIREIFTHKQTDVTLTHADLMLLPYWIDLSNMQMEAMKQLLQKFNMVHATREDGVMEWDSDLIVSAYWQTKTPASWLFLGGILRLNATKTQDGDVMVVDGENQSDHFKTTRSQDHEAVRVHWEFHFESGLPPALFGDLIVASVSPQYKFDAGPDWILYKDEGAAACRIMVDRDVRSLRRTIRVEAVVAEMADMKQVERLWGTFKHLCGTFVLAVREYPDLAVSSFAWDDAENRINMKRLVRPPAPEVSVKWMPPAATWEWFMQLIASPHRTGMAYSN